MTSQLQRLLCLVVAASPQAALAQFTPATTAPPPVAHVYVQTPQGVNLYNTSSTGKLTLAAGSPFKTVGLMVGTNGKYFISNGTNYVHVYAMSSTGAIGKEVSNINTALYSGAECGTTGPTVLDHTGQTLYVHPTRLWAVPVGLAIWLCHIWLFAHRGALHEDPVQFALSDPTSLALGLALLTAFGLAIL